MSNKSEQRKREHFITRENLNDVPRRTVYVYAHAWSPGKPAKQYAVAVRRSRARAYWAESKATKSTLAAAIQSARVWRDRATANEKREYKLVVTASVLLALIAEHTSSSTLTQARRGPNGTIEFTAPGPDFQIVYGRALTRKRAFAPPELLPAVEAILLSGDPERARMAVDYLGWGMNAPLTQTFEEMLTPSC